MRVRQHSALLVVPFVIIACESPNHALTAPTQIADAVLTPVIGTTRPGQPLDNLSSAEQTVFRLGSALFNRVFTPKTGLGPLFNASSCAGCHANGGAGAQIETHGTVFKADGTCDQLDSVGGQVFQNFATPQLTAATGLTKEPIPSYAMIGHRSTPQLFGRGLLEAIPDAAIQYQASLERRQDPAAAGRVAILPDGSIGRFGRKDNASSLLDFNTDAFLYEMGITTPTEDSVDGPIGRLPVPPGVDLAKDPEISLAELTATTDFVRMLAPLHGGPDDPTQAAAFRQLGCATCHVPSMQTGPSTVSALRHQAVRAYTDLLLHDMGPKLSDICMAVARPSEFRTEPLMGLGARSTFLHDGRATSVDEAILAHGGQASAARQRYSTMPSRQRAALLRYLQTL